MLINDQLKCFFNKRAHFTLIKSWRFSDIKTEYLVTLWLTVCTAPSTAVQGAQTIKQAGRVGAL